MTFVVDAPFRVLTHRELFELNQSDLNETSVNDQLTYSTNGSNHLAVELTIVL